MENKNITLAEQGLSFKDYLFNIRNNKNILWIAAIVIIIQFSIFKYFYPFASYIHGDSFDYLNAAKANMSINTYMIGYSMFLRLFSVFTKSDLILTAFQYLLLQASSIFLLFTIFYFYHPSTWAKIILLFFSVFNPLFLYLGNTVSSDALFASTSIIWFTLLIWIVHQPSRSLLIWHTVIIFLAFTMRYNALIYIFISALAILLSPQHLRYKLTGITAAIVIIGGFILHTENEYMKFSGHWQYSPFAGWQLANNAMYAYRYVDSADRKPVPQEFSALDNNIRKYFDSTRDIRRFPVEAAQASTYYMWSSSMPLDNYMNNLIKANRKAFVVSVTDTTISSFRKWAVMAPLYKAYGLFIIKTYPGYFLRHFIWPNANKYYAPPIEYLSYYNTGSHYVMPVAKEWFNYDTLKVITRTKDLKVRTLDFYPYLSGFINCVMLFGLIAFILLGGSRERSTFRSGLALGSATWLLNAIFTIFASSAALRFQSFPIILATVYSVLLLDWLAKKTKEEPETTWPWVVSLKRKPVLKKADMIQVISGMFSIVLLYTGIAKLFDYRTFIDEISTNPILSGYAKPMAITLPLFELCIVVLLVFRRSRLFGLYLCVLSFAIFALYAIYLNIKDAGLSCGCGGIIEKLPWPLHIALNIALVGLALWVVILSEKEKRDGKYARTYQH